MSGNEEPLKLTKNSVAFEYLTSRRGSKRQEIEYTELKMALYFLPNHEKITTEEQRNIFEIRNRKVPISSNFPKIEKKEICVCRDLENSNHIYLCTNLNVVNL